MRYETDKELAEAVWLELTVLHSREPPAKWEELFALTLKTNSDHADSTAKFARNNSSNKITSLMVAIRNGNPTDSAWRATLDAAKELYRAEE